MSDLSFSCRVFMDQDLWNRLQRFSEYHGLSLSRAVRLILASAPLDIPEGLDADEASCLDNKLQ